MSQFNRGVVRVSFLGGGGSYSSGGYFNCRGGLFLGCVFVEMYHVYSLDGTRTLLDLMVKGERSKANHLILIFLRINLVRLVSLIKMCDSECSNCKLASQ